MYHFLAHPTDSTYACGVDAVGRRNTRNDTNPYLTECPRCMRSPYWMPEDTHLEDRCAAFRELDFRHGTTKESPLHHDNRCYIHAQPRIDHDLTKA